jgi:hypothetical protein
LSLFLNSCEKRGNDAPKATKVKGNLPLDWRIGPMDNEQDHGHERLDLACGPIKKSSVIPATFVPCVEYRGIGSAQMHLTIFGPWELWLRHGQ